MTNFFNNTFDNKKILITGHTGFKGSWLTAWLKLLNANILGLSLDFISSPSHFVEAKIDNNIIDVRADIRDEKKVIEIINDFKPDYIFHLAAQALVQESYDDPLYTWETNVIGTVNVLNSLKKLSNPCNAIFITSDKCYDNVEWIWGYRETDKLGGVDPYSSSKAAAEIAINSFKKSFFDKKESLIKIVSARAGNVIGGGDWSKNRIIPDTIKAWSANTPAIIRNPDSTRPWQHVLEPISGYLNLAAVLNTNNLINGESFNFGPSDNQNYKVVDLVDKMSSYWLNSKWKIEKKNNQRYESGLLKLNCDKALSFLGWQSTLGFEETVKFTTEWYKDYYEDSSLIYNTTNKQILEYCDLALNRNLKWAL